MKSQQSSTKPRKLRLLHVRRVVGDSMLPTLAPGSIVIALPVGMLKVGDIVIIEHDGLEKIKRIAMIEGEDIFITGDNPAGSTDSRTFGWLHYSVVVGKILWPWSMRRRSFI